MDFVYYRKPLSRWEVSVDERIPESSKKVIRQILVYLLERPEAKDTVEGVLQWWLEKSEVRYQRKDVKIALDWLVTKGWVIERVPSQSLFGLNGEKRPEIQQFLMESENH